MTGTTGGLGKEAALASLFAPAPFPSTGCDGDGPEAVAVAALKDVRAMAVPRQGGPTIRSQPPGHPERGIGTSHRKQLDSRA